MGKAYGRSSSGRTKKRGDGNNKRKSSANNNFGYVGTIFDDVFKTLLDRIPEYIIPVINEVFGTGYALDLGVIQLKEELHMSGGKFIADSVLLMDNTRYHIEMQSEPDGTMAIRMIEYDFAIALGNFKKDKYEYDVQFPKSCVLYIRHNSSTPDVLTVRIWSDNDVLVRKVPIIKLQNYALDEIFRKKLLIFLPYYIVRYEKQLKKEHKVSAETIKRLSEDYELIFDKLNTELTEEQTAVRNEIIESIEAISSYILAQAGMEPADEKEVKKAMGGQVIEMIFDRARREGMEDGIKVGRREGKKEGKKEGRKEGRREGRKIGEKYGEERGVKTGTRLTLFNLYNEGHISSQIAADKLGISEEQFLRECSAKNTKKQGH